MITIKQFNDICEKLRSIIYRTEFENHLFAVGGCCRDIHMGQPIKDIDLVLDIEDGGIKFAEWMEQNGYTDSKVVTYPTYGTAMFKFDGYELECVQTRKEQYCDKDSRNPETEYGTLEEDIYRRDFTCNTLLYDISNKEIIDITGKGIEDIENKILRSPLELC